MKHTLLIITALMLVVGCSKPINDETLIGEEGLKYHPETKELYSGDVFKNYLGGKTEYEGSYKNGKQDGKWTRWHENGQKWYEGTFKDGILDGLHTTWYENGQKKDKGTYKDGKRERKWTAWYESGKLGGKGTYKDGKWDGLLTEWYENGQKKRERIYRDGKEIESTYWDEDGDLIDYE